MHAKQGCRHAVFANLNIAMAFGPIGVATADRRRRQMLRTSVNHAGREVVHLRSWVRLRMHKCDCAEEPKIRVAGHLYVSKKLNFISLNTPAVFNCESRVPRARYLGNSHRARRRDI